MSDPTPVNPPSLTPNVRIADPKMRRIVGDVLGWATIALLILNIVDLNVPALDLTWLSVPAAGILAGLLSLYQLLVTSPNVPTQ